MDPYQLPGQHRHRLISDEQKSWWAHLTCRRGTPIDDTMLRISGVLAGVALAGAVLAPSVALLAPLALYTVWTNGPHSPIMNGAYEPILMVYGQILPPLLVGTVATGSTVFVEWINYHLYDRARGTQLGRRLTEYRWINRLASWYARKPFAVIVFCALGPVPFWVVRILSVLTGYSPVRHLTATAVGRFPRLWVIAALGRPLGIPTSWLIGIALVSMLTGLVGFFAARWNRNRSASSAAPAQEPLSTDILISTSENLCTATRAPAGAP